jgi:hypothetical protein
MSKVQSVLFDRDIFTPEAAIIWLVKHNFKVKKIDITKNLYRFRQYHPDKNARYRIKQLPNGVSLVLEFL